MSNSPFNRVFSYTQLFRSFMLFFMQRFMQAMKAISSSVRGTMKSSKGLRGGTNDSYFQGEKVLREIFNHVCQALEMAGGNSLDDPVLLPKTVFLALGQGKSVIHNSHFLHDRSAFTVGVHYAELEV